MPVYCLCPETGVEVKGKAPRDLSRERLIEKGGIFEVAVRGRVAAVQESLQTMKGELVKEQQRSAGLERSRAAFVAAWRGNRMRSGAARTIQRHFRARRMLQLLDRTRLNAKVSQAAPQQAAGALAEWQS